LNRRKATIAFVAVVAGAYADGRTERWRMDNAAPHPDGPRRRPSGWRRRRPGPAVAGPSRASRGAAPGPLPTGGDPAAWRRPRSTSRPRPPGPRPTRTCRVCRDRPAGDDAVGDINHPARRGLHPQPLPSQASSRSALDRRGGSVYRRSPANPPPPVGGGPLEVRIWTASGVSGLSSALQDQFRQSIEQRLVKGVWAHNARSNVGFLVGSVRGQGARQVAGMGVTEGTRTPDLQGHNLAL
jgi:hypothetical protein